MQYFINIERIAMKACIHSLTIIASFTALSVSACRVELINDTSIKMIVKDQDAGALYTLGINGTQIIGEAERKPAMGIYMQTAPYKKAPYTKQFTVNQITCGLDKSKAIALYVSDIMANNLGRTVFERRDSANGHKKIVPTQGHH